MNSIEIPNNFIKNETYNFQFCTIASTVKLLLINYFFFDV